MLVVKVYMWPGGDQDREHLVCQGTLDCQGVAAHDDGTVKKGERRYRVRLLKGTLFGGPGDGDDVRPDNVPRSKVWKEAMVRGHRPDGRGSAARGVWDLVGGALKVILGRRLSPYVLDIHDDRGRGG